MVYNTTASQAKSIELFHVQQQRTLKLRPTQTADLEAMNSASKGALMESMSRRSEINLTLLSCFMWNRLPHSGHIHHFAPKRDLAGVRAAEEQPTDHLISHIYHGNRSCGHLAARGHCLLLKGGDRALLRYDSQRAHEHHSNDTRSVGMDYKVRIYE